jgi:hypothetical protein
MKFLFNLFRFNGYFMYHKVNHTDILHSAPLDQIFPLPLIFSPEIIRVWCATFNNGISYEEGLEYEVVSLDTHKLSVMLISLGAAMHVVHCSTFPPCFILLEASLHLRVSNSSQYPVTQNNFCLMRVCISRWSWKFKSPYVMTCDWKTSDHLIGPVFSTKLATP